MKVCSLFSGIGGIDLGFKQAGFGIIWANEFDHDAATTYRVNFGDKHLVEKDIRQVNPHDIPDFDVLLAGFPCQPFSIVGRQKGFDDPRGNLFFEIGRIIDIKRPSIVFLENVENLIEHDDGKTFLVIYNTLAQFGYAVKYKVLDSLEYGNVPQHRNRIFIVAFLDYDQCARFSFPEPIERTVQLNDILDRTVKHDDIYYYNASSFYYDEIQAKNIILTSDNNGLSDLTEEDFLNLIGRAGRFRSELYGNVICLKGTFEKSQRYKYFSSQNVSNLSSEVLSAIRGNFYKDIKQIIQGRQPITKNLDEEHKKKLIREQYANIAILHNKMNYNSKLKTNLIRATSDPNVFKFIDKNVDSVDKLESFKEYTTIPIQYQQKVFSMHDDQIYSRFKEFDG